MFLLNILDEYSRLDVVINNAGILRDRGFLRLTDDDWDRIIAVHLTGSYKLSQRAFRVMKGANYGRIVNTTSASGLYGNHGQVRGSSANFYPSLGLQVSRVFTLIQFVW